MDLVLYFSPTEGSKRVAEYAASYLNFRLIDITYYKSQVDFNYEEEYDYIVFTFPVYSQNIPKPVVSVINKLKAKYFIFLVTYGRMGIGNVLNEVSSLTNGIVIGGAYIPTKHSYKEGEYLLDYSPLNSILDRVINKAVDEVELPKLRKHLFANVFPNLRSRMGVRLKRTDACTNCNICGDVCPTTAINNGLITGNCIRCLACYMNCPSNGLEVTYSRFLKLYLKDNKLNDFIIY